MVSQVEVLSDREKELLSNYDRYRLRKFNWYETKFALHSFNIDPSTFLQPIIWFFATTGPHL